MSPPLAARGLHGGWDDDGWASSPEAFHQLHVLHKRDWLVATKLSVRPLNQYEGQI
jgi:hypothetical protein